MTSVSIDPSGEYLTLISANSNHRFHAIWLRDNAGDKDTREPGSGQRLIAINDIPISTCITKTELKDDILRISFAPEDKVVDYNVSWLERHAYDRAQTRPLCWTASDINIWDAKLNADVPTGDFEKLTRDRSALFSWLSLINRYGFGKVVNGPIKPGTLFQIVDLFGYVRETNYGRHFEVRTEINPTNLAYTSMDLQAHTDNPYRDPVPTVQVLYCLESSAVGGDNMVVDGFAAAMRLREENEVYFNVLTNYSARFEYAGDNSVCLTSRRPMIELSADGELIAVRFNNRSLAAITDVPFDKMSTYYAAYRRFGEIINNEEMEVTFRLNPGEAFVLDNTRVLHARKGYSGEGSRWLQGCYADKDGLRSTYYAMCRDQKKEAANEI